MGAWSCSGLRVDLEEENQKSEVGGPPHFVQVAK